jgi:hypothetical protein
MILYIKWTQIQEGCKLSGSDSPDSVVRQIKVESLCIFQMMWVGVAFLKVQRKFHLNSSELGFKEDVTIEFLRGGHIFFNKS